MRRKWPGWIGLVLASAAIATAWAGYRSYSERRFRAELDLARRDLASGQLAQACGRLEYLVTLRPTDGEAAYHLGLCEQGRGRDAQAIAAWAMVPATSPFAASAAVRRARLFVDAGRFTEAETLLEPLADVPGPIDKETRQTLELLYRVEGRADQVRRLILRSWAGAADPSLVLQRLERLDRAAYPIGIVRQVVDVGDASDDRVWLARANLARSSGLLDEASRWLSKCKSSRPNDQGVWLSGLQLAQAADDRSAALDAASHLPSGIFSEAETIRLHAWFSARGTTGLSKQRPSGTSPPSSQGTSLPGIAWPNSPPSAATSPTPSPSGSVGPRSMGSASNTKPSSIGTIGRNRPRRLHAWQPSWVARPRPEAGH